MSFKCPPHPFLLNDNVHQSPSRTSTGPGRTECLSRSPKTPDLLESHHCHRTGGGDDSISHSGGLRRFVIKRSLTNSFQSGHVSSGNSGTSGSSRSSIAGEKRHNDGSVVRANPVSAGRPLAASGACYLSPSGLENVSFCSASSGSNSQKSGSQTSYRSPTNVEDHISLLEQAGCSVVQQDAIPEKRRKLEEGGPEPAGVVVDKKEPEKDLVHDVTMETRSPNRDIVGSGGQNSSRRPESPEKCAASEVMPFFSALFTSLSRVSAINSSFSRLTGYFGHFFEKGDENKPLEEMQVQPASPMKDGDNPFSLLCQASTEKVPLSGQSVARGTTLKRQKHKNKTNRSCVSFDVNTAGRALLLKNGLDTSRKLHVLGRGGFGVVVKAIYQGKAVAVKIIPRHNKSQRTVESCLRAEMNALNLEHPNIVRAIRIFGFEERNALVIMELGGSMSLQTMVNDHRMDIPFITRVKFGVQIAAALEFCHERRILHLDVKPSNILISNHDTCKLGDFGCSRCLDDGSRNTNCPVRGTVVYQAPEVLRGCLPTEKADIYSLGITLWQMITREYPFHGERTHVVMYLVGGRGKRPVMPPPVNRNEEYYMKLVEHCWMQNPILRPNAIEVQRTMHGWKDSLGDPLIH